MSFARYSTAGLWVGFVLCVACGSDSSQGPDRARPQERGPTAGAAGAGSAGTAGHSFSNPAGTSVSETDQIGPTPMYGECENLQCRQMSCSDGGSTTLSGVVLDPAGRNPLYNVVVYVPNEPVLALPEGASCDTCDSLYSGRPIAVALTDALGRFVMEDVPSGENVPVVVQVGKWRRQLTIPNVTACTDNPQPPDLLRLPRNRMEGDIPKIAISTGSADTLECLLRRIGVDATEYVPAGGDGRIHIFQGSPRTDNGGGGLFGGGGGEQEIAPNTAPPGPSAPTALWGSAATMLPYDIVLLSCEGQETTAMNPQALHDYASAGGRVFASHFHYSWFNSGPYASENLAVWTPESNDLGDIMGSIVTTLPNGMPFAKGQALSEWLANVGALQNGLLPILEARHNADVDASHTASQAWILAEGGEGAGATQYFSFNTPTDALMTPDGPEYCGRVVYSDLHVGAASGDNPEQPVPTSCTDGTLSPQEAALEFMLFDLSSCITPDEVPPKAPVLE